MTKTQLQSSYDIKGFVEHPAFMPVLVYLAQTTEVQGTREPHTIINDEGVRRGRDSILNKLRDIGIVEVRHEAKTVQPYSESSTPKSEANKPK